MTEHLMTVEELYNFAKDHGFEQASIWIPTGTNVHSSVNSARIEISSDEKERDRLNHRVYLVYNS